MVKILIVDDEDDFLLTLTDSLSENGFITQCAGSGFEALSYLKEHNDVDCVLSDYNMPELRGDELAKMIIHEREIPVIIMSSDPDIQYDKIYRSGISGIMSKPLDAESFTEFLKINQLDILSEQGQQRKFLRRNSDTSGMTLKISNGRHEINAEISNISPQGIGLLIPNNGFTMSTVQFKLEKNQEKIKGYMHCRWRACKDDKISAGFEFDSITKRFLSKSEIFHRWIEFK